MKTIMLFYKRNYIEDAKVHHTWSEERIEEFVDEWCEEHQYNRPDITWCFLNSD